MKRVLTVREAAEELEVSRQRLYFLISQGRITVYRVFGRGMRILLEDLDDFIVARRVEADSDSVHRHRAGGSRH